MQVDVDLVLPMPVHSPTHWPARMRSAASAGRTTQVNTHASSSALRCLVFIQVTLLGYCTEFTVARWRVWDPSGTQVGVQCRALRANLALSQAMRTITRRTRK